MDELMELEELDEGEADGAAPLSHWVELAIIVEGPQSYYLGLIDVLQQWSLRKRLERFAKVRTRSGAIYPNAQPHPQPSPLPAPSFLA